jgi:hypothetical protein
MDSAVEICGLHRCALGLEEGKSSRDAQGNMISSQPGGKLVNEMYVELPLRIVIETFVDTGCLVHIIAVSEHCILSSWIDFTWSIKLAGSNGL